MAVTAPQGSDNISTSVPLSSFTNLVVGETYILSFNSTYSSGNYIYLRGTRESWQNGATKTITQEMLDGVVSFYAGVNSTATITNLMIRLSSVTDATFAPYSNVCPITGWTEADIYTAGTNLVPCADGDYTSSNRNTLLTCENGVFTMSNNTPYALGVTALISQQVGTVETVFGNRKRLLPGTYSFSLEITGLVGPTAVGGINLALTDGVIETKAQIPNNSTVTISEPLDIRQISCSLTGGYPVGASISFKVQLERSSSPSAWKQYQGTILPITFPSEAGTVYGGSITVNEDGTGSLVVDRAEVDLGSLTWTYGSSSNVSLFYAQIPGKENTNANSGKCSIYPISQYNAGSISNAKNILSRTDKAGCLSAGTNKPYFYVRDDSYINETAFKPSVSGQQLVYELATPITYTLSVPQVQTLLGTNNIWSDAGNIELSYWTHTP